MAARSRVGAKLNWERGRLGGSSHVEAACVGGDWWKEFLRIPRWTISHREAYEPGMGREHLPLGRLGTSELCIAVGIDCVMFHVLLSMYAKWLASRMGEDEYLSLK